MKNQETPDFLKWIIAIAVFSYIIFGIVKAVQNLM